MRSTVFLLSVLAPLLLAACSSTTVRADDIEESYIQTEDGALLHYRKLPGGDPVLVVPSESWLSPDLDRLAKGRTVIFYDLRNRGRSAPARSARMDRDLADLDEVRKWFNLERFDLLGFDYGAALIAQYATKRPDQVGKIVLVSPIPPRKTPYWDIYDRVSHDRIDNEAFQNLRKLRVENANRLKPGAWADAYAETILSGWVQDKNSLRNMKASPLVEPNLDPGPVRTQYRGLLGALGDWDWREELAAVQCPALVVHGVGDPLPERSHTEWVESMPQGQNAPIQNSGRLPWIERSSDFYRAVEGFLQ